MRVEQLHIDGFGRFHDKDLGPFPNRVTVFYGPNETGKSTLLAFIRAMLFGFPLRRARSHYPPLAGGRHGGGLSIADSEGRIYMVRRFQGPHGGPVIVSLESGEPIGDAILGQLLGGHPRDVFNSIFAFTIDELHSDDLLKDSKVNSQMYSTGIGATALPDALTQLEGLREDLFLNRGSTQKIYHAVNRIDEIDSKLRDVANYASEYGRHRIRLDQIDEEIGNLESCRAKIQSQFRVQTQLRNAWDDWVDLITTEQELRDVPAIDNFPQNGLDQLNRLSDRVRTAREEKRSAFQRMTDIKVDLETPVDATILNHIQTINWIFRQRGAFDQSVHDLPERKAELVSDRGAVTETLSDLGSDWDEDRLEKFDVSMSVREEIQRFQDDLRRANEEVERRASASRTGASALKEVEEDIKRQLDIVELAARPQFTELEIRERRSLIRRASTTFGDLDRAKERVSDFEFRTAHSPDASKGSGARQSNNLVSWALILGGIALTIASFILGGPATPIGILGGIVLAGVAVHRLFANRSSAVPINHDSDNPNSDYAKKLNDEVDRRQRQINEIGQTLDISTVDPVALNTLGDELDEEQARLNEWNGINERLDYFQGLKKQRKIVLTESNRALKVATGSKETIDAAWRDWIHDRRLSDTFAPETVIELRAKVDQGKDRLKTVRERQRRIGAIETEISQFLEIVEPLAIEFDIEIERGDLTSVALAADKLIELRSKVEHEVSKRESAEHDLEEAESNLRVRKNDVNNIETEVNDLLDMGGAQDEEDFRRRHEQVGLWAQLETQRRESIKRLQRLSAPGEQFENLMSRLRVTDAESIEHEIGNLEERGSETGEQIQELYEERGGLETQIKSLVGEEESSALRMQRSVLLEQVSDYSRNWAIFTVAKNLLVATRRDFERERQPRVLRHAESYFRDITEERYSTIYAPLGEQKITVRDYDGSSKAPSDLSRGTREQLFLSLRFGLIKELGEQTEPLPVIVDEVMVNFDPPRASLAASNFVKLSESNQVLVFTCHPTTVEIFQAAAKQHNVEEFDVIALE